MDVKRPRVQGFRVRRFGVYGFGFRIRDFRI